MTLVDRWVRRARPIPEESPKGKRAWNRTRREVRPSTKSPKSPSESEESTFLVRVKKGENKAKVLFLDQKNLQDGRDRLT